MDIPGPITTTVQEAALLLQVIAGYDPGDPATLCMKHITPTNYVASLDPNSLSKARIGVNRGWEPSQIYVPHIEKLLQFMTDQGAELVEIESIPFYREVRDIMRCEFKAAMDHYLATAGRNAVPRTMADIVAFNTEHGEQTLRYGQSIMEYALEKTTGKMTDPCYLGSPCYAP